MQETIQGLFGLLGRGPEAPRVPASSKGNRPHDKSSGRTWSKHKKARIDSSEEEEEEEDDDN
jgi:hypothetical protein